MEWLLSTLASTAAGNWQQNSAISGDLRRLRNSLPAIRVLIDRAEQWRLSNPDLEELLFQLRDANYDAEDLIDDFAYHEQQQKIEGSQQGQASRLLSSSVTFLKNVIDAVPDQVKEIQGRLDGISAELRKVIVLLNLHDEPKRVSAGRVTSSFVIESEVIGRDEDLEKVIALLLQSADGSGPSNRMSAPVPPKKRKRENVSVLPIVGIGGMGKTTLAQLVYNDPRVSAHFLLKIWVCVSDFFDVGKLTKEIIDNARNGRQIKEITESEYQTDGRNLDSLQVLLNKMMSLTRFLLVLDDVWNEDRTAWEKFYAPLRNTHRGSMIIATTRSQKVADIMGAMNSFHLGGLSDDSYWQLFKRYAFGLLEDSEVNHELKAIGRKIISKLKGSPLAAKTVGSLLNSNMDVEHWRTIMNSDIWELPQKENDILPALRLSYQYLPPHLKHCFSLCSIFPKDYNFTEDLLLDIWIAQGFIAPKENMPLHIVGTSYLHELTTRSFFQPYLQRQNTYVIHDLMHDLAQSVLKNEAIMIQSENEAILIQNDKCQQRIPSTVRHMSIWNPPNLETSWLKELSSYSKLRSLLLIPKNSSQFFQNFQPNFISSAIRCWFDQLRNIRLLIINHCNIKELPGNISNLKHLRYLDISYNDIQRLPESLGRLYNLQVLAAYGNNFKSFPKEFRKLTNLSKLYIEEEKFCMVDEIGKLTSLRNLPTFKVLKEHDHGIGELKDLMQLHGKLHITCLQNVESREDACQARLHNKEHLDELVLEWSAMRVTSSVYDNIVSHMEVLEGLQPHSNLKKLEIRKYVGNKSPNWLQPQFLPYLSVLRIENCPNLAELPCLPPLLEQLAITSCPELRTLGGSDFLPSLKFLSIFGCPKLAVAGQLNFDATMQGKSGSLSEVKIDDTSLLKLPFLRNSLSTLQIWASSEPTMFVGEDEEWLQILASLKRLYFLSCPNIKSLPSWLHGLTSLQSLEILSCPEINSLPERGLPASLRQLSFSGCHPMLKEQLEKLKAENSRIEVRIN